VIHERLVADCGFAGSYQRVKMHLASARPRIAAELAERDENPLAGLHRRFEVVPGAQAQVDWGEEGLLVDGLGPVFSFHMTLSHSRDPFACFTHEHRSDHLLGLPSAGLRALRRGAGGDRL
jgi:transposase